MVVKVVVGIGVLMLIKIEPGVWISRFVIHVYILKQKNRILNLTVKILAQLARQMAIASI